MLLRRLAVHVKTQNWFAVWLDFLIVVVGVFIGFQVTGWNEQRSDRAMEADYLQRIHAELIDAGVVFESIIRDANESRVFADYLSEFYDERVAEADQQRLVVAIRKFGLDPIELGFDVSTFNDLVSTGRLGLISDAEIRRAIQRTYTELQRLDPVREPYRDEYMSALRGLIPRSMNQQIIAACPDYTPYSACSDPDFDDDAVRLIVERMDTREALVAFHNRDQMLGALAGIGGEILEVLDHTLARFE